MSFAKGGEKFTKMKRNERNGKALNGMVRQMNKAKWYGKTNELYGIANVANENDYGIVYIEGEHLQEIAYIKGKHLQTTYHFILLHFFHLSYCINCQNQKGGDC